MLKKVLLGILLLFLLLTAGFIGWASATNPIMPTAVAAMQSDAQVQVTGGNWLVFQPLGKPAQTGLIFYPGAKVDHRAYAPYAHALASQGFLVIVPRMPLNLAVFDAAQAGKIIAAYPQVKTWALGGHSLGGSMAANYAASHPDQVRGLVLLASYPGGSDHMSKLNMKVLSMYGTKDGLATGAKIDASRALLPPDTRFQPIPGGNHAQFGDYGFQDGDSTADISRSEQQAQAVSATVEFLNSLQSH